MNEVNQLDAVLTQLEEAVQKAAPADALDRILAAPARTSAAQSLRDTPVMQAFRTELAAGMVRAETAIRVLDLAAQLVTLFARSAA